MKTALFLDCFGVDRFFPGHTGMGLPKLFTLGGCGILWIADIIANATGSLGEKTVKG